MDNVKTDLSETVCEDNTAMAVAEGWSAVGSGSSCGQAYGLLFPYG
jgi:hypothetical protein